MGPPPLRSRSSCPGLLPVVPMPGCAGGPSCLRRHVSRLPLVRGGSSCLLTRLPGGSSAVWARCAGTRLASLCLAGVIGCRILVLRGGGVRSVRSLYVVCNLVPASIVTSRRSCSEYRVPPPLNANRMAAWVSWQAALCLLMNWSLWVLHSPAMWVQESGSPHNGHASVGACLYL